jgi:hypothetical protein
VKVFTVDLSGISGCLFNNIYLFKSKRLIEKFGGSQITKSGSYNTNKSIIQIDIPTQGRSSWGT